MCKTACTHASSGSLHEQPVALQSPGSYAGHQLLEDLPLFQEQTPAGTQVVAPSAAILDH